MPEKADYRDLLSALKDAAEQGVKNEVAKLSSRIEEDAKQRLNWKHELNNTLRKIHNEAGTLSYRSEQALWRYTGEWLAVGFVSLAILFSAAMAYRWAHEPQIVEKLFGCTGKWNPDTNNCDGTWIPLSRK